MSEYKPTEARLRERVKGSLGEYAHEFGLDGEAAMDEWIDQALAERDNRARADERAKLQDRIEVLEKNLAYEVAQKIKLAEQLQAATTTSLTLEQARWKMHAGIDSRCSEEVAAKAKPVIDLVLSSLALEPEAREEPHHVLEVDVLTWHCLKCGRPARGHDKAREVTDAAVVRALVAYGYSENDLRFDPGVRMRAALRAAWEVE